MNPMLLPSLGEVIRRAMWFDPDIFAMTHQNRSGLWMALAIVALAGLSAAIGQSLVLFINRIRPWRFAVALLLSVVSYLAGYVVWTTAVWAVGVYLFGAQASWVALAAVVGLAYAPQILSFFELVPFFGNPFGILLSLWSMALVVAAVQVGLGLEAWQAVVAAGLGWLLYQLLRRTLGRPVYALWNWMEQHAIGVQLRYSVRDLPTLRRDWARRRVAGRWMAAGSQSLDVKRN